MLKKRVKKGGRGRKEAAKKAHAPSPSGGTITDELRSQLIANNSNAYADQTGAEGEESNVLIVGAKKKKEKTTAEPEEKKPKLTAKQKRRLAKLQEKDQKKKQRIDLFQSLSNTMLTPDQMKLLHPSSDIGKKETKKDKLSRAFREQKTLGYTLTNDVQLEQPVTKRKREEEEDDSSEGELQYDDNFEIPFKFPSFVPPATSASTAASSSSSSTSTSTSTSSISTMVASSASTLRFDFSGLSSFGKPKPAAASTPAPAAAAPATPVKPVVAPTTTTTASSPAAASSANSTPSSESKRARKRRKQEKKKEKKKAAQSQEQTAAVAAQDEPEPTPEEPRSAVAAPPAAPAASTEPAAPAKASKPAFFVPVSRLPEVEKQRKELPIYMEEQRIMEGIKENDVVVICGETGSGKTTQVPQFLYEAGYGCPGSANPGMVAVTQPRRVAAVSMAQRVSHEINAESKSLVSYQIRYDSTVSNDTRIKFMTDGILLKEIQGDFLMKRYSVIIIDEAHERNLNTDILIGLLSRIVPLRAQLAREHKLKLKQNPSAIAPQDLIRPLKLVIMSATLRVSDFVDNAKLFPTPPPVISVDARQFPVTVHFNRRTVLGDYIGEAYKKVCKIHQKLPQGGVLVFLTGQQEIEVLCRKLRTAFPPHMERRKKTTSILVDEEPKEAEKGKEKEKKTKTKSEGDKKADAEDSGEEDMEVEKNEDGEKTKTENEQKEGEAGEEEDDDEEEQDTIGPLWVLPLYSALPTKQQLQVFEPPPAGYRLVVVATNVAETSLTIPGIKYVVDSGRAKERVYERASGMSSYVVQWESQASANQRAGRAGRTGPGHCYRLFSSAVFNDQFAQFSDPEISRIPIEGVVLQMKSMGIDKVVSFPFPTPPDMIGLKEAHRTLSYLGALDKDNRLTPLGRSLATFPVAPRYAKMLVLGHQGGCLPYVIALVAALSVDDPLLRQSLHEERDEEGEEEKTKAELQMEEQEREQRTKRRAAIISVHNIWAHPASDLLVILRAIGAYEYGGATDKFCEKHFLNAKIMKEIHQLREQLTYLVNTVYPQDEPIGMDPNLQPPSPEQELLLRQVITAGLVDQVARLHTDRSEMGYINEAKAQKHFQYMTVKTNEVVYVHPSSFLFGQHEEYVVYRELVQTKKTYMKGVTAIHPSWLCSLGTALCQLSKPLETPPPRYDAEADTIRCFVSPTYGPNAWTLPVQEADMEDGVDRYKYFMRFLLEGKIIPSLKALRENLSGRPSLITAPTTTQHKILAFLQTLSSNKVYNKKTLMAKLKTQPKFLLAEMKLWVNLQTHELLEQLWSKLTRDNQK